MPQRLITRARGAGSALSAFTPAQKLLAVLGVAVLVLGGAAFSRWATAPTYAPLFSDLAGEDAQAITEQLTAEGVEFALEDGGTTIMVPKEAVSAQRIKAAAAGLPGDSGTGYHLLDTAGMTSSQFQQQITYQRALEGELASTIEGIDGVNTAVVHLAVPEESIFDDQAGTATASVLVDTAAGAALSDDQVQSVVHLVSSSVPDLGVDQVTVSDSEGTLLSAAGSGLSGGIGGRDGQTDEHEQRTEAAVQAMLDRVVGPGNAVATVTAELDFDQTQRVSEDFTSTPDVEPLSESSQEETYTGGAAGVGGALGDNGVLGMDGQEVTGDGADGDSGYTKTSITRNNAVNKVTETTTAAPGAVRRQSVAVVVDTTAAADAGVPQLTQLITAAAGIDAARGDTLAVSQLPFDTTAADAAAEELAAAAAADAAAQRQQLVAAGGIGLLVLVLLIVLALLWRRAAKKRSRQVVDLGEIDAMYRRDDVITQDGAAVGAGPAGPQLVAAGPSPEALRRAEVGELVDQQPTEVAAVLRGWLSERTR